MSVNNYTVMLVLFVFIEAHYALKYIKISTLLRQVCRDLITIDLRRRGEPASEEDVEEELYRLLEKKDEEL